MGGGRGGGCRLSALTAALSAPTTAAAAPAAAFLHTMIRVQKLEETLSFFEVVGITVKGQTKAQLMAQVNQPLLRL